GDAKVVAMRTLVDRYLDINYVADSALGGYRDRLQNDPLKATYYTTVAEYLARWLAAKLPPDFKRADFMPGKTEWLATSDKQVKVELRPANGNVGGWVWTRIKNGTNQYFVFNIVAADIDQLNSFRTEFTNVLSQNNGSLQALIDHLEKL